jgi:hypothetical protein
VDRFGHCFAEQGNQPRAQERTSRESPNVSHASNLRQERLKVGVTCVNCI